MRITIDFIRWSEGLDFSDFIGQTQYVFATFRNAHLRDSYECAFLFSIRKCNFFFSYEYATFWVNGELRLFRSSEVYPDYIFCLWENLILFVAFSSPRRGGGGIWTGYYYVLKQSQIKVWVRLFKINDLFISRFVKC